VVFGASDSGKRTQPKFNLDRERRAAVVDKSRSARRARLSAIPHRNVFDGIRAARIMIARIDMAVFECRPFNVDVKSSGYDHASSMSKFRVSYYL